MKPQPKQQVRYRIITETITGAEAQAAKVEEIQYAKARIEAAKAELVSIRDSELILHRKRQVEVLPGEDGYEEAGTHFDPAYYAGDVIWKTI